MIKQKKGLSTVVTTLIIILLVLVAVGIIWIVVRGVIEEGTGGIDYSVKCLEVDVKATNVSCSSSSSCDIVLTRKAGGDAIDGVMLVFYNTTDGTSSSTAIDVAGNIPPLTTKTTNKDSGVTSGPDKVNVNAYFLDEKGEAQVCSLTNPFLF
jgi:hypothetical protein